MRAALPLLVLAAAALALFLLRDGERAGVFDTDEAEWLTLSTAHWQQLAHGDDPRTGVPRPDPDAPPETNPWKAGVHQSTFGFMNPGLPKAAIGAALDVAGHREWSPDVFRRFTRVKERKRAAKELVLPALPQGRRVMLVVASAIAALLFAIGRRLWGTAGGVTAAALWVAAPLTHELADRVLTDLFPLLFALMALHLALVVGPALGGRRGTIAALVAGSLVGLPTGFAVGSKLNGALVAIAALAWVLGLWLVTPRDERPGFARGPLPALLAGGLSTATAFLVCCPFLLHDPASIPGELGELLDLWGADTAQRQDEAREGVEVARSTAEKVRLAYDGTFHRHEPVRALTGLPAGLALVPAGLVALLLALRRREGRDGTLAALALVAALGLGTALWIPLDWSHYFAPLLVAVVLTEAALIGVTVGALVGNRP